MTVPKQPRRPLVVNQRVSSWLPGKYAAFKRGTVPYEKWVFDRLMCSARQVCSESEGVRVEGESVLRAAAALIARGDSDHFYRVATARDPRAKKAARAELLEVMRRFRKRNPDRSMKDFVSHAEGDGRLITRLVDAGVEYTFRTVEPGEYVLRSLDKLWAQAGKAE